MISFTNSIIINSSSDLNLWRVSENYLNLGQKAWRVISINDKNISLEKCSSKVSALETALKVISYLLVVPLAAAVIINLYYKHTRAFKIVDPAKLEKIQSVFNSDIKPPEQDTTQAERKAAIEAFTHLKNKVFAIHSIEAKSVEEIDGILVEITSLKETFLSKFNAEADREEVETILSAVQLQRDHIELSVKIENKLKESIEKAQAKRETLGLPPINPNIDLIRQHVEKIIHLQREKKVDLTLRKNSSHLLKRRIAKGTLAVDLGVGTVPTKKGIHGTLFVKSLEGKFLGVFKSIDTPFTLKKKFGEVVDALHQNQRSLLNPSPYVYQCSEKAAYLVASQLNFKHLAISPVEIITLEENKGAFLVFAKKVVEAKEIAQEIEGKVDYSEEELNRFQSFIIFDFLIGNMDRHLDNWMVKWKSGIKKIVPIDNANAFPRFTPKLYQYGSWRNQYAWRKLKIARMNFTEETKNFVKMNLREEAVEKMLAAIDADENINALNNNASFLTPESKALLRKRAEVLRDIGEGKIATCVDLARFWNVS